MTNCYIEIFKSKLKFDSPEMNGSIPILDSTMPVELGKLIARINDSHEDEALFNYMITDCR